MRRLIGPLLILTSTAPAFAQSVPAQGRSPPAVLAPAPSAGMAAARKTEGQPRPVSALKVAPKPKTVETTWLAWAVDQLLGPPDSARRKLVQRKPAPSPGPRVVRVGPGGLAVGAPVTLAQPAPAGTSPIETGAISSKVLGAFWRSGRTPSALRPIYRTLDVARVRGDLPVLELASRSYEEILAPGGSVFRVEPGWRVVESARTVMAPALLAEARASGFEAVVYEHAPSRRLVVAIAGSRPSVSFDRNAEAIESWRDAYRDWWINDIKHALLRGVAPPQFKVAVRYIEDVMRRHGGGGNMSVECTGHSLGGGACVHAATELGLRATTLNPISAGTQPVSDPDRIANYVMQGEVARVIYGLRGLAPTGVIYLIEDGHEDVKASTRLYRFGPTVGAVLYAARELIESFRDHSADAALDRLSALTGIARLQ